MKNLLLIAVLSFSFSFTSFAYNNPANGNEELVMLLSNEIVDCFVGQAYSSSMISANYSVATGELFYEAQDQVSFVQILNNAGELVYQLPIGSKKIYISLDDFDQGDYEVNFLIDNSETMITTTVIKK